MLAAFTKAHKDIYAHDKEKDATKQKEETKVDRVFSDPFCHFFIPWAFHNTLIRWLTLTRYAAHSILGGKEETETTEWVLIDIICAKLTTWILSVNHSQYMRNHWRECWTTKDWGSNPVPNTWKPHLIHWYYNCMKYKHSHGHLYGAIAQGHITLTIFKLDNNLLFSVIYTGWWRSWNQPQSSYSVLYEQWPMVNLFQQHPIVLGVSDNNHT